MAGDLGIRSNFKKKGSVTISDKPQPALLFMPDISGFTQFVTETEQLHSQHIIQELLEILIDSNQLNLQVCEVEGDAIFFYRLGEQPSLPSLLSQVEKMFTRFHAHLKLYGYQRICGCGACKSAMDLTLKVIIHFGEVSGIAVKQHKKLFGRDVILLHRLLKNNLDTREYVLLTEHSISEAALNNLPSWYLPQASMEEYDAGLVHFIYSDLSELHKTIRINVPVYNASAKTYVAFSQEQVLSAPMEKTFETMLNMQRQLLAKKDKTDPSLLKIGEKHPCLITRNNNVNVTESVKMEPERIEMVEMNEKGIAGYRYVLQQAPGACTNLCIEMLIKNNPFYRLGFAFGIKSKMMKKIHSFFMLLTGALKEELPSVIV